MKQSLSYVCPSCDREVVVGKPCGICAKRSKPAPVKSRRPPAHDEIYDGLDLPDDDFDYDEFVAREFGHMPHKKTGVKWYWWVVALAVLSLMALGLAIRGDVFSW
jgi:hypothetical protein